MSGSYVGIGSTLCDLQQEKLLFMLLSTNFFLLSRDKVKGLVLVLREYLVWESEAWIQICLSVGCFGFVSWSYFGIHFIFWSTRYTFIFLLSRDKVCSTDKNESLFFFLICFILMFFNKYIKFLIIFQNKVVVFYKW